MSDLSILVVDDHEIVRHGVTALLEAHPGWKVCAEATDGREAVELAKTHQPDVVILDLAMPGLNGLETTRRIRRSAPRTAVVVLTMHNSEQIAREVLQAGARGYILKSDAGRDLVQAVEAVARGQHFLTSRIAEVVLESYLQAGAETDSPTPRGGLTEREREIVQLLSEGRTNKEVASRLNISTKTVETHRANIMRKLRLKSLGDLIRYAIRNRITEP